ncbi:membrane protein [Luteolibacter sp. LG18]|nr:membrane protein [Luteolibacter sp. LG18]
MMVPAPGYPLSTPDERTMGLLCHLLPIFTGFLGPLILWLVKKEGSPFVDHHGREALNFQISKLIYFFGGGALTMVLVFAGGIGIFLIPLLMIMGVLMLVAEIMAALAANRGEWHRYPCCIRVI